KALPDAFASDADRLQRFQREAQVLASLNHPNIAQIYGLEESDKTRCIVMELVEGETQIQLTNSDQAGSQINIVINWLQELKDWSILPYPPHMIISLRR